MLCGDLRAFYIYSLLSEKNKKKKKTVLILLFQFGYSWLIAVLRTSNIMLNRNGKGGHTFLDFILEKLFRISTIEYEVSCGFVINGLYYFEICSLYTNSDEFFVFF